MSALPIAQAAWLLPSPGRPEASTFSARSRKSPCASSRSLRISSACQASSKIPPLVSLKIPPSRCFPVRVGGSARGNSPSPLRVIGQQDSSRHRLFELGLEQTSLELFLESKAFSFDIDCNRMVQQAVEDRASDHGVAEYLAPRAETLIAGDDDGAALIAARDQLEEQIGTLAVDGQIANLVADQKLRLGQHLEPFLEPAFSQRLAERGNQGGRGDEQGADPLLAGFHAERHRQVSFPDSGRT